MTEEEAKSFKSFRSELGSGRVRLTSGETGTPISSDICREMPRSEFMELLPSMIADALSGDGTDPVRLIWMGRGRALKAGRPLGSFVTGWPGTSEANMNMHAKDMISAIERFEAAMGKPFLDLEFRKA
jgi:hypothetical protein